MQFLRLSARAIDRFNDSIGQAVAWLALGMVLVQFVVVVMRYIFGIGSIFMQESIVYMHGFNFLLGSAYTLLHEGHVRVDIFYRTASARNKALTDLLGSLFLLIPFLIVLLWTAWPYVGASWAVLEGSQETSGIPGVFVLKTTMLVFVILMLLQALSMAAHAILVLAGKERPPQGGLQEGL